MGGTDTLGGEGVDPHHPWHVAHQGYTVLVTNADGAFTGVGREGLFDFDTRILSAHEIELDGRRPKHVSSCIVSAHRWSGMLRLHRGGGDATGPLLPQDALELAIDRRVGRGMSELLRVTNHSMTPIETELLLHLDADFADVQELGQGRTRRERRGGVRLDWDPEQPALVFDYRFTHGGKVLRRALRVVVEQCDSRPEWRERRLRFRLRLRPRQEWRALLAYQSQVDGIWRVPSPAAPRPGSPDPRERLHEIWSGKRTRAESDDAFAGAAFERAAEDLFALRNWEYDEAPDAWFPVAGVPTYTGVFGRDCLTAGWQGAMLGPEMLRGALAVTARTQSVSDEAFRDQEPGKLIHEMRRGPLSELGILPQGAYYGTQTTPAMFVLALSEHWHWSGDESLLRRYRDVALRAMEWAERRGDLDDDGLLEYVQRSPAGLKNQAWKDSDEAIRYPDGSLVANPIATIEEQAYYFIALQRMAEILVVLDEERLARRFLERAQVLAERVEEAYWVEEDGFYAMALDSEKRPVRSVGSNPGHALATGMVPARRAERVAARLLATDLFSGWGVRTLSTNHPSYNPWAYHLGAVWPVENATFALGMKRYGLDVEAERIACGMLEASAHFRFRRLPEALSGHAREASAIPSAYPRSNSPQAWSASATVQLVQVMLGLYPFAPANAVGLVRPRLPPWMDSMTLRNLRIGSSVVSIRFERGPDGGANHEIVERHGPLHVWSFPPPQDVHPDRRAAMDSLKEWLLELAPGRVPAALRIALGELEL